MARLKKYKNGTQVMSFSVPRELHSVLDMNIKRLAGMEGISVSEWIWRNLQWVISVKEEGNSQVQLPHILAEHECLSKTIQAKFILQDLTRSLDLIDSLSKERQPKVNQRNFQVNNIRKLLPKAESLSRVVFAERFDKVFKRINSIIQ